MAKLGAKGTPANRADPAPKAQRRPFVCENEGRLSLHFDRRSIQSAMNKEAPFELVLSYTRYMMAFLLFQPAPRDLLIVGLGGGSLSKYCYRHLPQSRITTVEISERIIRLRNTFAIPADDGRFRVLHADGAAFIADQPNGNDVILVDGYDERGLPRELGSQHFYDSCAFALRDNGVLVANFLQSAPRCDEHLERIGNAFGNPVMSAWCENRRNRVAYVIKGTHLSSRNGLLNNALILERDHDIDFRVIASKMLASIHTRPVA